MKNEKENKEYKESVGALWEKESKREGSKGKRFLSGKIFNTDVLLFESNEEKIDWDIKVRVVKEDDEEDSVLEKCGYLISGITKDDFEYFKGEFQERDIFVFTNKNKKEEKHPDWVVYENDKKSSTKTNIKNTKERDK